MGQRMMGGYGMMDGYGGVFMMLLWALLIVGIVLLIVWLVRQSGSRGGGSDDRVETALDILKKRYAKGEIGKEEFEQMKRELM